METLTVRDGSDEVRVEITGTLAGASVEQLRSACEQSQSTMFWRRLVIDISGLTDYDTEGHELLHRLHGNGAVFAAPTPRSLDFLEEITSGVTGRVGLVALRRSAERAASPRPRHRAGHHNNADAFARFR